MSKKILLIVSLFVCLIIFPVGVKAGDFERPEAVEVPEDAVEGKTASDYFPEEDTEISAVGGKDLSAYSNNYIYSQLGSSGKTLWSELEDVCNNWYTSSKNISSNTINGKTYYPVGFVSYSGLTNEEAIEVTYLFRYCNPVYYFLDGGINYTSANGGQISLTAYQNFASGSARSTATAKVESKLKAWNAKVSAESGDVAKEKTAHDLIVNNTTYTSGADYNQSAYSVLVNGKSVCAGYSAAFSLLMNYAGIETFSITSQVHEWNVIYINGNWYHTDVTYDDPVSYSGTAICRYTFFNRSYSKIKAEDSYLNEHTPESLWSGLIPQATKDSGATATSIGSVSDDTVSVKLTLNANGGYIGSSDKTKKTVSVTVGKKYGTLTSPCRKGYTFKGWYTKKSSGSKVTSTTLVTAKKAHTLYAHWSKISVGTSKIKNLKNVSTRSIVVYSRKASGASGIQICYSLKKNMKNAKTVTTTKTKATISSLKKGKTYYVKIRSYVKDSAGKKVYGAYTSVSKIKVSK